MIVYRIGVTTHFNETWNLLFYHPIAIWAYIMQHSSMIFSIRSIMDALMVE